MRHFPRSLFPVLLALPLALLTAAGARAQGTCDQCTQFSGCDDSCTICSGTEYPDGTCSRYTPSTCGASGFGACIRSGCTPNFVEVSRDLRGTYGDGDVFTCQHHRVEWVTRHDVNQCNTNPTYWDAATCEDHVDADKYRGFRPDCCNGFDSDGNPDPVYTCNHWHSC